MDLYSRISRRWLIGVGVAALAAVGAGAAWAFRWRRPPGVMEAGSVSGDLPLLEPESKLWRKGDDLVVPLLAQQMAFPRLKAATIKDLTLRALFNGKELGFLLEWGDEKADDLESIVAFRDAAAVMLPMQSHGERPPVFMGMGGKPVYILQWKASWQKDIDQGFQDVEKSYPNWSNDVYPGHPALERYGMTGEAVTPFYPGLASGNPLSQQKRISPVEEMVAEGFGTLTTRPQQQALGRGVYTKGRWKVTVGVPMGEGRPALQPGQQFPVAFAVWDGGRRQVGGRKHFADWIQVTLPGGA